MRIHSKCRDTTHVFVVALFILATASAIGLEAATGNQPGDLLDKVFETLTSGRSKVVEGQKDAKDHFKVPRKNAKAKSYRSERVSSRRSDHVTYVGVDKKPEVKRKPQFANVRSEHVTRVGSEFDDVIPESMQTKSNEIIDGGHFVHRLKAEDIMKRLRNLEEVEGLDEEVEGMEEFLVWTSIVESVTEWKKKMTGSRRKRDEEVVCYDELGCFRDVGFFNYLDTLPEPPEAVGTNFLLYTRRSRDRADLIDYKNTSSLYYSRFKTSRPIKIIIHGFGGGGTKKWVMDMKDALLRSGDFNVIVVDWEKGSDLPNYVQAAANTKLVAKQLSLIIGTINSQRGKSNHDYHIIGFSLGAHVAGYTGMYVANLSRITGLDPAAPLFEGYENEDRLDRSDANFVDVIHSNGERLLFGGLGAYQRMGDVDYYPNGGKAQTGCANLLVGALSDIFYGDWKSLCNHRRAYQMFTDSITPSCPFPSFACDTFENFVDGHCFPCPNDDSRCGNMGFYADKAPGRGQLYLVTRDSNPFCANQYLIQVNSSTGNRITWGKIEVTLVTDDAINDTFELTRETDEIVAGSILKKVVVVHPDVKNITKVRVRYVQYDGWLYDGKMAWGIDSVAVVSSDGKKLSYCGFPVKLRSDVPVTLPVDTVECSYTASIRLIKPVGEIVPATSHRRGRVLWVHAPYKRFPYPFYVPHETSLRRINPDPRDFRRHRNGRGMNFRNSPRHRFGYRRSNRHWRGWPHVPRK